MSDELWLMKVGPEILTEILMEILTVFGVRFFVLMCPPYLVASGSHFSSLAAPIFGIFF